MNPGEGAKPWGGLVLDTAGNLYGTTTTSYIYDAYAGTVFKIAKTSTGYAGTPTTWYTFPAYDGEFLQGTLIINSGKLFGTAYQGTTTGDAAVFAIAGPDSLTYLNGKRNLPVIPFNGTDGANPVAGVIADAAGNLFGTTYYGGKHGYGEVFEVAKTSTGYASPTPLHSFNSANGANPQAGLFEDATGNLFGTTRYGGAYGYGTVFELVRNAGGSYTFTLLVSFNGNDGAHPIGGLISDAAGNLFGTTYKGGRYNDGTVFELMRR